MGFLLNPYVLGTSGAYSLPAAPGALVLGGGAATLTPSQRVLAAAPGALVLGGGAATLAYSGNFSLSAAPGALVLGAGTATLTYSGTPTGHRYWRVYITDNNGGSVISLAELELYDAINGSNVATGGTASASSEYNSGFSADKAFDGSLLDSSGSSWASSGTAPQWIAYDLGSGNSKAIVSVGIHARASGDASQMVKDFDVQYSDDGVSWTTDWSETGHTGWGAFEFRRFDKTAGGSYSGSPWGSHSHWRVYIHESNGSEPCIAELEYLATPAGTDQATGGSASAENVIFGYGASNAFDDDVNTLLAMSAFGYCRYDFPSPVAVSTVKLTVRNENSASYSPKNFKVQFADSASGPWTTAWTLPNETGWSVGETRTFTDPAYV